MIEVVSLSGFEVGKIAGRYFTLLNNRSKLFPNVGCREVCLRALHAVERSLREIGARESRSVQFDICRQEGFHLNICQLRTVSKGLSTNSRHCDRQRNCSDTALGKNAITEFRQLVGQRDCCQQRATGKGLSTNGLHMIRHVQAR